MKMTLTCTSEKYAVHELLTCDDTVTPCDFPDLSNKDAPFDQNIAYPDIMHVSEAPGANFFPDADGFWRQLTRGPGRGPDLEVQVDAGPILHRGR